MQEPVAHTRQGAVQGVVENGIAIWRGIPYAAAERFLPPAPPAPWQGLRAATAFGPACPQPREQFMQELVGGLRLPESEDCLSLNVWAPAAEGIARPVLVFIHGGAYETGSGAVPWYDGSSFAGRGDLVVVTLNYRLGPLGFLHLGDLLGPRYAASGNLGLLDQIAALRWVRDNIGAFGGDPDAVTVMGESAGAGSIGMLLGMPEARGLFRRAILESGSGQLGLRSRADADRMARRLLAALDIRPEDAEPGLLGLDAQALADAGQGLGPGMNFSPVLDGLLLPEPPLAALARGSARDTAILIGANRDEYRLLALGNPAWFAGDDQATLALVERLTGPLPEAVVRHYRQRLPEGSPYERHVPILTYLLFVDGLLRTVDAQAAQGAAVFQYRFDWATPVLGGRLGACHALELPFVFHNLDKPGAERVTGQGPERAALSEAMHDAWIAFARSGDPSHAGLPAWPAVQGAARPAMVFSADPHLAADPWGAERAVWREAGR